MQQSFINANGYSIFIGDEVFDTIRSFLSQYEFKGNKVFVLADGNTRKYCLPRLMSNIQLFQQVHILEVPPGEETKSIETAIQLWQEMLEKGADRDSVLINLGGGMVSDLGGFVASNFKRGIRYVNIPTTLLAMVDASIGGKVGVDILGLKNQIGLFSNPQVVFIIPEFLDTLPERQLKNGFAEVIKHSLIYESHYWEELSSKPFASITDWKEIIEWSVEIKNYYVMEDPLETGFRKVLNFGHTVGHAIEAFSLQNDTAPICHGEAIAAGMICELYISTKLTGFPQAEFDEVVAYIRENFSTYPLRSGNIDLITDIMRYDKKNRGDKLQVTLLTSIGNSLINQPVETSMVRESLHFYMNL
ncbi:MAG: 3-dehydroquinate synthase [Bacteroidales bacterium]